MRKLLLLFLLVVGLNCHAQGNPEADADTTSLVASFFPQPLIGYVSYEQALKAMPQYVMACQQRDSLRQAYDAELKRVEEEFNQKYEAFLEGRKDFPRTILLKRQTELQQLLERNVAFKEQSRTELQQAWEESMRPLRLLLDEAIATLARQHQLILVVNTDSNAAPFIEPAMAINLNADLTLLLQQ